MFIFAKVRVDNANAMSSMNISGPPGPTTFLGFGHAFVLSLNKEFNRKFSFGGAMQIVHSYTERQGTLSFAVNKNTVDSPSITLSEDMIIKCNMDLTLCVSVNGRGASDLTNEQISFVLAKTGYAGGRIGVELNNIYTSSKVFADAIEDYQKKVRPGFGHILVDKQHFRDVQIGSGTVYNDYASFFFENLNTKNEGKQGYNVAYMSGYIGISDVGQRENRGTNNPNCIGHCVVEPAFRVGEYITLRAARKNNGKTAYSNCLWNYKNSEYDVNNSLTNTQFFVTTI